MDTLNKIVEIEKLILPLLGIVVLIFVIVVLIKVIKLINKANTSIDKLNVYVDDLKPTVNTIAAVSQDVNAVRIFTEKVVKKSYEKFNAEYETVKKLINDLINKINKQPVELTRDKGENIND